MLFRYLPGFRDKPPVPPSHAQWLIQASQRAPAKLGAEKEAEALGAEAVGARRVGLCTSIANYGRTLLRLLKNRDFVLLVIAYGKWK